MNYDEEVWKPIEGFEGLYSISNLGRVKSYYDWNGRERIKKEHFINGWLQKPQKNRKYCRRSIRLVNKDGEGHEYKVHRLVAKAFVPNPNNYTVVNHLDFNPLNNRADNLEWTTDRGNFEYSYKAGRHERFTKEEIEKIIGLYEQSGNMSFVAKRLGMASKTVSKILKKNNVDIRDPRQKYNIDLDELLDDFKKGKSYKELENKYSCSHDILATRKYQFRKRGLLD